MDSRGQLSVELIFIVAISIMVLLTFTIPIGKLAIENNMDSLNSLNAKFCIDEIANGVDSVYCQGQGAKKTLSIVADMDYKIVINPNSVYCSLKLHDNKEKTVKQSVKCKNVNGQLFLSKGLNTIVVEWPDDSNSLLIIKN